MSIVMGAIWLAIVLSCFVLALGGETNEQEDEA
jgi:hypothetical protein